MDRMTVCTCVFQHCFEVINWRMNGRSIDWSRQAFMRSSGVTGYGHAITFDLF